MLQKSILLSSLLATGAFGAALPQKAGAPRKHDFAAGQDSTWQIILSGTLTDGNNPEPQEASVWDLDLYNTDASVIQQLKESGKTVICYFSAGTYEPDRPDSGELEGALGNELPDWPGEYWLNLKDSSVLSVMQNRVQLAAENGCDAVDPDNMDGYQNDDAGGFGLTQEDSVEFLQALADTAHELGMGIGIKNALDIVDAVESFVDFAVNEECSANSECNAYDSFISSGKPVFHIEYDAGADSACEESNFATVIKTLDLDGYVQYCDGSTYDTPTDGESGGGSRGGGSGGDSGDEEGSGGDDSEGDDEGDYDDEDDDGEYDDSDQDEGYGSGDDEDDSYGDDDEYDEDEDDSYGDSDEDEGDWWDEDEDEDYSEDEDYDWKKNADQNNETEKKKGKNPVPKDGKNKKSGKKAPRKGGKKKAPKKVTPPQ